MPDRESVITHLQIIHTWAEFARERDLQFFTAKHLEDIAQWTKDALAILKEQEAVVPGIAQDVDGIFATCGNCKKKIWKMMGLEFVVNPDEMPRFCPHCGRSVKFE